MKQKNISYEILLFAGTHYASRKFCRREDDDSKGQNLSPIEEMEKNCWDGMLYEIFPGIIGSFSAKCESFIWHIISGKNFLRISIGPVPVALGRETVLDPYLFIQNYPKN